MLRRKLRGGLVGVAVALTNEGKVRATRNVFTGEFRNSITHTEERDVVLWGIPANAKNLSLESGFRPHWVPLANIYQWAARKKALSTVTVRTQSRFKNGSRRRKRRTFLAAGVYVGGPGSRLDYGRGFVSGFIGRKFKTWRTQGDSSEFLGAGKVGFSVVQWTVKNRLRGVAPSAFARGYSRG
jgi:hypothetical protein